MIAALRRTIDDLRSGASSGKALGFDVRGSVATEYGLIAALVVIVVIVGIVQLRSALIGLPIPALIAAFEEALS